MEQKYVIVKDSNNNKNIWQVICEDTDTYTITTRMTLCKIEKNLCKNRVGSSLLFYNSKHPINIFPSNIEIEKWSEYENYLLHNIYVEDITI